MVSSCFRGGASRASSCPMMALIACVINEGSRASDIRFIATGCPLSGSRSASMPVFSTIFCAPETTYFRLAAGRGRRYTDTVGWALFKPYAGLKLQPVGSRTTSIENSTALGEPSALRGGHESGMRYKPRLSRSECDFSLSCGKSGQFDPSNAANTGSLPSVASQRSRKLAADTLIPYAGWWQFTQARPLAPNGVKNGCLLVSTGPE